MVGDGLDEQTGGGPVVRSPSLEIMVRFSRLKYQVSKGQYDRVWGYIEAGKQEGAKVVLGGTKRSGKGYFVDPTSEYFQTIRTDFQLKWVSQSSQKSDPT